jgi:DNA-binding beta-propeller fold protein YncE
MNKKGFLVLAGVFAALFCAALGFYRFAGGATDILESMPFSTGLQNRCLAYDETGDIFLVGTYNNELVAFSPRGERLWSAGGRGPFVQLIVHGESRILYAGNEDNNVYIIDLDSGNILRSINVERRIFNIDVTPDGEEILISAGTVIDGVLLS